MAASLAVGQGEAATRHATITATAAATVRPSTSTTATFTTPYHFHVKGEATQLVMTVCKVNERDSVVSLLFSSPVFQHFALPSTKCVKWHILCDCISLRHGTHRQPPFVYT